MSEKAGEKLLAYQIAASHKLIINGELETIIKIIPMEEVETGKIKDVEFLLDQKKNRYFSYNAYRNGTSWVNNIEKII